jgi:Glycosyltransferases, probably involved in cell wall biogenesis
MSEITQKNNAPEMREVAEPFASFIMCVNRDNPWLDKAINSVLAQDDERFEFLIGANACGDDLWAKLHTYAARDPRLKLFRTSIGQLAFNLNLLADQARGRYLIRMDGDDLSLPHRLRTLRQMLEHEPVDVLGSAVILVDQDDNEVGLMEFPETGEAIAKALPKRTVFCHPSVAIRKEFLLEMRGYLGGFVSEDMDLWLRAVRGDVKLKNLPVVLLHYRVHPEQSIMSAAGYAEVASHWVRECLLRPSLYNLRGATVAIGKALAWRWLSGIRRYRGRNPRTSVHRL